jgi:hypothetical protein
VVIKEKAFTCQLLNGDLKHGFGRLKAFQQYAPVPAKAMVDVAHIIVAVAVQLVVMGVAAVIAAEFFIRPAAQGLPATDALFCFGNHSRWFI